MQSEPGSSSKDKRELPVTQPAEAALEIHLRPPFIGVIRPKYRHKRALLSKFIFHNASCGLSSRDGTTRRGMWTRITITHKKLEDSMKR